MARRRAGKARWKAGRGQVIAPGRDQHRGQGRDMEWRNIGHGRGLGSMQGTGLRARLRERGELDNLEGEWRMR